ncbi:hypothetical protein [Sphaerimonospora thailandensis]|uniref:Uncharacterized protein n=1 Tax=Sphaerimonospora thailandensis TaxID=795644 RepID=A0A8J3R5J8_9ACTN|nr:hypothetical protein [Sphaerimonospora thailandensis]GIH68830.1 hypothetical protein Mth01_10830 [Sphaerimonospora thailandensis]
MAFPNERYDLLNEYELHDVFIGAWCKGLSVAEAAARLRVDPDSATECVWAEIGDGLGELDAETGVVWIGEQAPGWTQIIQYAGLHIGINEPQLELSDGGALLYLGWPLLELEGPEDLEYVVDGRALTSVSLADPDVRCGPEPDVLDRYMDGLPLDQETPVDELLDAAFQLVGRVTGRELDAAWLRGSHTRYIIPAGAWDLK